LAAEGYRFGAVVIDAVHFVPQSRPRLFVVAVREDVTLPASSIADLPDRNWHTRALVKAHRGLSMQAKNSWIWWKLPSPPTRIVALSDLIETGAADVRWHSAEENERLLALMNAQHREKLALAMKSRAALIGMLYKRTRREGKLKKRVQRGEVRFDGVA